MRRARQDHLLLTWMESLPESVVRRSPVLSIWSAWSHLMSGDLDAHGALARGRRSCARRRRRRTRSCARAWADTEDLRTAPATISIYRASLAQARGDVAGTVRHARQALDLAGARGPPHPRRRRARSSASPPGQHGNVAEALDTFGAAVRSLHAAGNLVDELDATVVLADMWVALGRPGRARELYERGLQRATQDGEPYPRATADLHVGLAELDRELDDLPAPRSTSRRHGCSLSAPPSPRTGTGGTSPWRRCAPPPATTRPRARCSTRPRRSTGPASTPRSAPSRP